MKRLAATLITITAAVLAPGFATANSDRNGGWTLQQETRRDGNTYALYARPVAGSDYAEFRMEVPVDAAPDDVLAAIEHNMLDPESLPDGFSRRVLRREGRNLLSHDFIRVPFVSDRDAIMRTEFGRDEATGHLVVRWFSVDGHGPGPEDGVVRMPSSRGSWTLHPREGGTLAVYRSHVELGGSLPASLVTSRMPAEIVEQGVALRRTLRARQLARR